MKLSEFHHLSVPGDGGCFFHSIVAILKVEKSGNVNDYNFRYEKGSMNLRKKCVSWLKKNLNYKVKGTGLSIRMEIEDAINNEAGEEDPKYSSVSEYLKFISDNDAYAGQIEIYAVSELLKRNIRVFTSKKKTPNAVLNNLGLGYEINNSSEKDIFLYHNFGKKVSAGLHHFEPLIPKKNISKGVKEGKSSRRVKRKQTQRRVDRRRTQRRSQRRVDRRRTQRRSQRQVDRRRTQRRSQRRVDRRRTQRGVHRRRTQRRSQRRVDRRKTRRK